MCALRSVSRDSLRSPPTDQRRELYAGEARRRSGSWLLVATRSRRVVETRSGSYFRPTPERHPGQSLRPDRGRRSFATRAKTPWTDARPRVVRNPAANRGPLRSLLLSYPRGNAGWDAKGTRWGRKSSGGVGFHDLRDGNSLPYLSEDNGAFRLARRLDRRKPGGH
jgi:hypothetical protein